MSSESKKPNSDLTASKLFSVSGFTAVVTGGGTGIGLMITQALVANGAKVYIAGRRQDSLDTVVKEYSPTEKGNAGEGKGEIIAMECDISNREEVDKLVKEIEKREGNKGIHLLVNNAGVAAESGTTKEKDLEGDEKPDYKDAESVGKYLMRADQQAWRDTMEINLISQYFVAAAFVPLLGKAQKSTPGYSPSIIMIASISGVMKNSSGGQFAYAASKAGVLQLTNMLAATLHPSKIRVNCIAPGIFPSEMTASSSDEKNKSTLDEKLDIPAGRPGKDEDMAAAVLYLAGPGGVYLNGQVLYPDGGMTLTTPAKN